MYKFTFIYAYIYICIYKYICIRIYIYSHTYRERRRERKIFRRFQEENHAHIDLHTQAPIYTLIHTLFVFLAFSVYFLDLSHALSPFLPLPRALSLALSFAFSLTLSSTLFSSFFHSFSLSLSSLCCAHTLLNSFSLTHTDQTLTHTHTFRCRCGTVCMCVCVCVCVCVRACFPLCLPSSCPLIPLTVCQRHFLIHIIALSQIIL